MKKTALIVGANSDIAYEFTKVLAKKNFKLILLSPNYQKLIIKKNFLSKKYKVKVDIKKFNIIDTHTFDNIMKKYSNISLIFIASGFLDKSNKNKKIVSKINYLGPRNFIKKIPKLKMKNLREVICITSVSGDRIDANKNEYSKAKKKLSNFLKNQQKYFFKRGILLKDLKLGYIKTNMTKNIFFSNIICASSSELATFIYNILGKKNIKTVYYPKEWIIILKIYNFITLINPFSKLYK